MKFSMTIIFAFFLASTFAYQNIEQIFAGDPSWPRQCVAPDCNVVARHLRYPTTIARNFYQCRLVNNVWRAESSPCPCEHLFDYLAQTCFRFDDSRRIEWCINSQDQGFTSCGGQTTTAPPGQTTTTGAQTTTPPGDGTTTPPPGDTTTTPPGGGNTTPPPGTTVWTPPGGDTTLPGQTTTTDRYSTVTWG